MTDRSPIPVIRKSKETRIAYSFAAISIPYSLGVVQTAGDAD